MSQATFNLYCDESCHLENDGHKAMVLGALIVPRGRRLALSQQLKDIKRSYAVHHGIEVKWATISPSKLEFYLALIDWFFDTPDLRFRAMVVPNKELLDHQKFDQSHDDFYYKCWYHTIVPILSRTEKFNVYLDKKDTRSQSKAEKLREVLSNKFFDFDQSVVSCIQHVHSHEVPLFQLSDLLIGAVSYVNRGLNTSSAKVAVIQRIRERSGLSLSRTTLLGEKKMNLLVWRAGSAT